MTASGTEKTKPYQVNTPPLWKVFKEGAENGKGAYVVERQNFIGDVIGKVVSTHQDWLELWFSPEQCQELYELLLPEDSE